MINFHKFKSTADSLKNFQKILAGKLPSSLQKFLNKNIVQKNIEDSILVADRKISKMLNEGLGINS